MASSLISTIQYYTVITMTLKEEITELIMRQQLSNVVEWLDKSNVVIKSCKESNGREYRKIEIEWEGDQLSSCTHL